MRRTILVMLTAMVSLIYLASAIAEGEVTDQQLAKTLIHQTQVLQAELNSVNTELAKLLKRHKQNMPHYRGPQSKKKFPVISKTDEDEDFDLTPSWIYSQGTPVTSSPYMGIHCEYNGSNLIVSKAYINEDLSVLKQRQRLEENILSHDLALPQHPLIVLSGKLEGQAIWNRPFAGTSGSDIDLATGEFISVIDMNRWVTGFASLSYDNTPPLMNISARRISNSRIFLNRGFIVLGNLNLFPGYFTIGQTYVPFGRYASSLISAPLTLIMARTNGRLMLLGYHNKTSTSPYAQLFVFKGDASGTGNPKQGGVNFGYEYNEGSTSADIAAGIIANMADSDGMQGTGGGSGASTSTFPGFGMPVSDLGNISRENLVHKVPGFDIHGLLSYKSYVFIAEYLTALRAFDITNLMYNNSGAKPKAMHLELTYDFNIAKFPSSFTLTYGRTSQALALNIPQQRYATVFAISLWKDTIESIEYRHDVNYGAGNIGGGTLSANSVLANTPGLGHSADTVTVQLGAYW